MGKLTFKPLIHKIKGIIQVDEFSIIQYTTPCGIGVQHDVALKMTSGV
jgi:hypothetical protein